MAVTSSIWIEQLSQDIASNSSRVRVTATATTSGQSHNDNSLTGYKTIDGVDSTFVTKLPSNSTTVLFSEELTVYHNAEGYRTIYASFSLNTRISAGTISGSTSLELTRIPRYASFTEHYVYAIGLNSISVHWNSGTVIDAVQYSVNGGAWVGTAGLTYTINGLNPNTAYNIRTRIKRADSQLWTESGYLYATTQDIAKITKIENIHHGDSADITITNPSRKKFKFDNENW